VPRVDGRTDERLCHRDRPGVWHGHSRQGHREDLLSEQNSGHRDAHCSEYRARGSAIHPGRSPVRRTMPKCGLGSQMRSGPMRQIRIRPEPGLSPTIYAFRVMAWMDRWDCIQTAIGILILLRVGMLRAIRWGCSVHQHVCLCLRKSAQYH
jgi:hypothetical protein